MDGNIVLNNEIKMLIKEKRYEETERLLEFIINFNKNSNVLNILGLLSYRRGFYKKSRRYFFESYSIDSNKDAQYYLDVLFEENNVFSQYYLALKLCKNKRYEKAEPILEKITNIKQARIICFIIAYIRGSLFKRRKILKAMKHITFEGGQSAKIYRLMHMNYINRIRRIVLYFLFIIFLFIGASLILV